MILLPLLGSRSKERILIYLMARGEGYAREMSRFFSTGLAPLPKQLESLEAAGGLVSRSVGRTRLFELNPRYPLLRELEALLKKALAFYSVEDRDRLAMNRRRPRRSGKPL